MRGFLLDSGTHDFALDAGGRLQRTTGLQASVQEIKCALLLFRGEYFLDLRRGVPYFQEILKKGVAPERIREIFRAYLLALRCVVDVPSVVVEFNRATRAVTITWEARTVNGIVSSEDLDLVRPVIAQGYLTTAGGDRLTTAGGDLILLG